MSFYKNAGVDIDKANSFVEMIKPIAKTTTKPGVMSGLGGFGSVFDLKAAGFKDPLLISGTDGVGSKLKLAQKYGMHGHIGIDLVMMCANDILCHGARPLFFLDYYATGKLDPEYAAQIIDGIAIGCRRVDCALVGGETAELPSMYNQDEWELAGFCVGAVERKNLLPKKIRAGDTIIGIVSSGMHANGFSMIKTPDAITEEQMKKLLAPTKDYVRACLSIMNKIKGLANITGGGIIDNIPRIIPDGLTADIEIHWKLSELYSWIRLGGLTHGETIPQDEMLRTFNCGIGMAVITTQKNRTEVWHKLMDFGHQVCALGTVVKDKDGIGKIKITGELK